MTEKTLPHPPPPLQEEITEYYEETGLDYSTWSRKFNMHFGHWCPWLNPFVREPMLEDMNRQVIGRLQLQHTDEVVFDMGCGLGATMRSFAHQFPGRKITGVTLVPWQVEKAQALNLAAGCGENVRLMTANFLDLPLPDACVDAAYALESCCHSPGADKALFLAELHRVLKPGGRFVIVDGFTKTDLQKTNALFRKCLDTTCRGWALPCFPALTPFLARLDALGFSEIKAEDISWQVAPSVLHAPFCVSGFLLKKMLQGERLNAVRIGHLKSCLLGLVVGLHRQHFGYFIISGRKS